MAGVPDLGLGEGIPAVGRCEEVFTVGALLASDFGKDGRAPGGDQAPGACLEGGAAGKGFEAAAGATVTRWASRVENDVSDFTGETACTAIEPAVEDETATDAGPDGDMDHVPVAAAGAETMLAQGCGGSVVLDEARDAEGFADRGCQRKVTETCRVGRDHDLTCLGIDEPGRGNAGGGKRARRPGGYPCEQFNYRADDVVTGRFGWRLGAITRDDVTSFGDNRGSEVGGAEVGGEDVPDHAGNYRRCGRRCQHRRMEAMLNADERDLLAACRSGVLGTIGREGRPHLVPVCYALVGEELAIAIDEKPKQGTKLARVRNIERDGRATLLVDHYSDDWEELAWVRVDALGSIEGEGANWPEALAALRERYAQYRAMELESLPLIRLAPERVVSWRWSDAA